MKPYGHKQEPFAFDRERDFVDRAMSHNGLRGERADKRRARAEGDAEIRNAEIEMLLARDDTPGTDLMRCAPDCPICNAETDWQAMAAADDLALAEREP